MKNLKTTKNNMLNQIKRKSFSGYGKNLTFLVPFGFYLKYNDMKEPGFYLLIIKKQKNNFTINSKRPKIYIIEKT